jgi:hypothetical protein
MAYCKPPNAPPHGEPDNRARASSRGPTAGSESAQRGRFKGTGVYQGKGDTGSRMPASAPQTRATSSLVLGAGKGKR